MNMLSFIYTYIYKKLFFQYTSSNLALALRSLSRFGKSCSYIYIYIYICMLLCIYIYIYREREWILSVCLIKRRRWQCCMLPYDHLMAPWSTLPRQNHHQGASILQLKVLLTMFGKTQQSPTSRDVLVHKIWLCKWPMCMDRNCPCSLYKEKCMLMYFAILKHVYLVCIYKCLSMAK